MSGFHTGSILLAALITIFLESTFTLPRDLLGAQINPLPPLMVYAALRSDLATLTLLAVLGSLWQSALSADPLGVGLLPLFLSGLFIEMNRQQFAQRERFVRFTLGAAASASVPLMTLFLLFTLGRDPMLNWFTLWQWVVVSVGGGLLTMFFFPILDVLKESLTASLRPHGYLIDPGLNAPD
ncbi:MAG: hypothetical protein CMO66_06455 [Verrucomicrobiales bacterium]|nr:hypothetical protein [Verrucomicrobiales bacterium]